MCMIGHCCVMVILANNCFGTVARHGRCLVTSSPSRRHQTVSHRQKRRDHRCVLDSFAQLALGRARSKPIWTQNRHATSGKPILDLGRINFCAQADLSRFLRSKPGNHKGPISECAIAPFQCAGRFPFVACDRATNHRSADSAEQWEQSLRRSTL